jgi:hypothetical protein
MLFSSKLCARALSLSALLVVTVKATLYKQESAESTHSKILLYSNLQINFLSILPQFVSTLTDNACVFYSKIQISSCKLYTSKYVYFITA